MVVSYLNSKCIHLGVCRLVYHPTFAIPTADPESQAYVREHVIMPYLVMWAVMGEANSTTITMLFSALLCSSIALSSASPLGALLENQVRFELSKPESSFQVPNGFNIDLESMRLVQFNDGEEPVWISELDKVCLRATTWRTASQHVCFIRGCVARSLPRLPASASLICRLYPPRIVA